LRPDRRCNAARAALRALPSRDGVGW